MKNKGFTLIELLAVIVILAIIALIAVPIIINIINGTKESSSLRKGELYLDAVEQAAARKNLDEDFNPTTCEVQSNGNLLCDGEELVVEVDGEKPTDGTITFDRGIVKKVEDLTYKDVVLETDEKGNLKIKDGTREEEQDKDNSGANTPELSGLIPVVYKDNAWVIADTSKEWYDYDQYNWANAVILTDSGKVKSKGQALNLDTDVRAMFVWIPRYEYKKVEKEISVNFISGTETSATEGYTIHPAFTFGEDELDGIWVGKFETSTDKTSTCYTSASETNCNNANQDPYILPNVKSLRYQQIVNQFATAKKFDNYIKGVDSHMMKNREWGAVAYLSQSKYGKYGKDQEEVYINNCSNFITGIAGDTASIGSNTSTCTTNTYNTVKGQKASTTGTIYGIYDMSGGSAERVMGNYNNTAASSGIDATWFTLPDNAKYYDKYTVTSASSCTDEKCKGHALGETAGWYGDYLDFVNSSNPWFSRGGYYGDGTRAGVFCSFYYSGGSVDRDSFRVVLAPTTISK